MIRTSSLIEQLNESAKTLAIENKDIFDDIVVYMRTSNIKTRDAEDFLQQILDSFLNAEHQGVSIISMLGTSDIKSYCEEIVNTYKLSYDSLLYLYSEYIRYIGMLILTLSFVNYITYNLSVFIKQGVNNLTFYLTFNLGFIFQFLLVVSVIIAFMSYIKKSCFEKKNKSSKSVSGKAKKILINWILGMLFICIIIALFMCLGEIILFRLNIIIVLIIGGAVYFIGDYFSEK